MRWSLPLKGFAFSLPSMPPRLKVLISAYACEPGKGSEPEVGWNWALQMSRFHDVTVLTRKNNRAGIERAVAELPLETARPGFVYHDLGPFFFISIVPRFRRMLLAWVSVFISPDVCPGTKS